MISTRTRHMSASKQVLTDIPLEGFVHIRTTNIARARADNAKLFCPHRLSIISSDRSLNMRHHAFLLPRISLHYLQYGPEVLVKTYEKPGFFLVEIFENGNGEVTIGKQQLQVGREVGFIGSPDDQLTIFNKQDSKKLIIRIERQAVEQYLGKLTGVYDNPSIKFEPKLDATSHIGKTLYNLAKFLTTEADKGNDSILSSAAVIGQYEDFILGTLLTAQFHNCFALFHSTDLPIPRRLRIAEEYMRAHFCDAITMSHLVAVSNLSIRSLQVGFKRYFNNSPMGFLKDLRLRALHDRLRTAGPEIHINSIMMDLGINHLGRCAMEYKKLYGESPSETLNGRRKSIGGHVPDYV